MLYNEVIPNLYHGNQQASAVLDTVDVVISIGCKPKCQEESSKMLYKVAMQDSKESDLKKHLSEVTELMDREMKRGKKVLLHCQAGINRSTAFLLAYLCKYKKLGVEEARELILAKRPRVRFQKHYVAQIVDWL
ncbi:MAG: dual specificity protein phosphatase [Spirochaetota bacterium]